MKLPAPAVDYRDFRFHRINEPQYRHVWFLLFWPVYILRYMLIEQFNPADYYHPVQCVVDEWIPFCEWFVIPYVLWYVLIFGVHVYTFFYDVPSFKRYSRFLMLSMSISTVAFLIYPTCQNLRPAEFPRNNFLTDLVGVLYRADTNTNVCPSEHAIGSVAALCAVVHTGSLRTPKRITVFAVTAFFAAIATVFLKQHSFIDVLAALPVCGFSYLVCYAKRAEPRALPGEAT